MILMQHYDKVTELLPANDNIARGRVADKLIPTIIPTMHWGVVRGSPASKEYQHGNTQDRRVQSLPVKLFRVKVFSRESEGHVLTGHIDVDIQTSLAVFRLQLDMLDLAATAFSCNVKLLKNGNFPFQLTIYEQVDSVWPILSRMVLDQTRVVTRVRFGYICQCSNPELFTIFPEN